MGSLQTEEDYVHHRQLEKEIYPLFTYQQRDGDSPELIGLLPDSYILKAAMKGGPSINPGTIQLFMPQAYNETPIINVKMLKIGRFIHALGDIKATSDSSATLDLWPAKPTDVLVTGLSASSSYDVRVANDCIDDTSTYKYISFYTDCGPMSALPLQENFDSYTHTSNNDTGPNNLPNCWAQLNTGSSYSACPYVYYSSSNSYSGNYCMRFYTATGSAYSDQYALRWETQKMPRALSLCVALSSLMLYPMNTCCFRLPELSASCPQLREPSRLHL